ncbi:AraC family transcriptional regulator [Simiduia litorea]|uniref:AraC family transcriptional regulator n=1 Tax=Simiduia litorea TaxID=1435348 RepID=UPI0036F2E8C5
MTNGPDVIGCWLTLFASALSSYNIDAPRFLTEQGVDYALASDPNYRLPVVIMAQLWHAAVAQTGDKTFGLKAGTFVTPMTFSALGVALWSCCTIRDHFNCLVRYMHVFTNAVDISVEETDEHLITTSRLRHDNGRSSASDYAQDAVYAAMITLSRSHYKADFSMVKLELTRAQPEDEAPYLALFRCPVSFGHALSRAWYKRADVDVSIPGCNREMAHATEKLAQDYLAKLELKNADIQHRVQNIIVNLMPQGEATLERVADILHMSSRTLHRKLEAERSSFRLEMEAVRQRLAREYMLDHSLSLGDISFLLGFSSSSNFTRAFRRWTGKTPQDFRQIHID